MVLVDRKTDGFQWDKNSLVIKKFVLDMEWKQEEREIKDLVLTYFLISGLISRSWNPSVFLSTSETIKLTSNKLTTLGNELFHKLVFFAELEITFDPSEICKEIIIRKWRRCHRHWKLSQV